MRVKEINQGPDNEPRLEYKKEKAGMSKRQKRITVIFFGPSLLGMILAAGLVLGLSITRTQAQVAIYVDDNVCPAVGSGTMSDPYCKIQDAVNAAGDGYEIRVAAGTYSGPQTVPVQQWEGVYTYTQVVIITKSLTLQGGYTPADWYNPDPTVNTTIIDAQRHGRGVSIVGNWNDHPVVTVDGFTIKGGDYTGLGNPDGVSNQVCASTGSDCGGGLFAYESKLTLRNCIITDNIASRDYGHGGGIYLWPRYGGASPRIENTIVISNTAMGTGSSGGGMYAIRVYHPMTITQSIFRDNISGGQGGGLTLAYNIEALVTISETDFINNSAQTAEAGGARIRLSENGELLRMDRVRFQDNSAYDRAGAFYLDAAGLVTPTARLTNLLFAGNSLISASDQDAVVGIYGGFTSLGVSMAHVTAADNSAVTFLYAEPDNDLGNWVTVTVTNTLLSFFTNAFAAEEVGDGEVTIQHANTLMQYVANQHQNLGGSPTFNAIHPLTGDPRLDSTYHLRAGSDAIDAGVDAGVTTDIDGDPRPYHNGFDIGADEFTTSKIYLPLVVR
jgi:hypothetical protein